MQFLQIRDFGKSGLNTDLPAWDLPPSFLNNASNFRIFNNKLKGFAGHETVVNYPGGFVGDHVLYSPTATVNYWIHAGDQIYVYDGVTFTDVSTSLQPITADRKGWTSCHLGRVPVLNNSTFGPIYWTPKNTSTDFQLLPYDADETWVDKQWTCRAMRSYGSYLIAMNMRENSVEYPDSIRWSHPAERNEVPANWNEADPASLASLNILGGDAGAIVDGLALRNSFVIYRDFGITVLDYRDDNFVFNARNLTETLNIANINCIAEVKGVHFIAATNDLVMNNGTTIKSILHNRMRSLYSATLNSDAIDSMFAVHNSNLKEVWFFIPTGTHTRPSQVWAYNYINDTVSLHDVDEPNHADFGRSETDVLAWQDWHDTWQNTPINWGRSDSNPFLNTMIGVKDFVMGLETNDSEVPFTTTLERTDYPLTTMQDVCTITRLYPHVKGTKAVYIQVGSQKHAGDGVAWKPLHPFVPGKDRKIDVRTTGELFAFRIVAYSDFNFEFSGMDIEFVQDGLR